MCHFTNKLLTVMVISFVLVKAMDGGVSEDFL